MPTEIITPMLVPINCRTCVHMCYSIVSNVDATSLTNTYLSGKHLPGFDAQKQRCFVVSQDG